MKKSRRKLYKLRGERTHGGGASKNRRGKGSRKTNKRTYGTNYMHVVKYEPWRLAAANKGFHSLRKQQKAVNLDTLLIQAGRAGMAEEIDAGKLGFDKVLGSGRVEKALKVKARAFSENAKQKIEKAGGQAITTTKK